jgi:hemolysin activation/secretion protein
MPGTNVCHAVIRGVLFLAFVCLQVSGGYAAVRIDEMSQSSVIGKRAARAIENALDEVEASMYLPPAEKVSLTVPQYGSAFFVSEIRISGANQMPEEFLRDLARPFEGRKQTVLALQGLADQITAEYRARGYINSQAYIPPQELQSGVFVIAVLEGRIGRIIFEGNHHYSEELLRRYCSIKEGDVLSYPQLQKTIGRLNQHSDRTVQALIRPGAQPGESDVVLKVHEKGILLPSIFADNQGSKAVGQNRFGLGLRLNNLLRQDDTLRVGGMAGQDFASGFMEHSLPIARINSVWKTGVSNAKSLPKKQYKPYGVSSTTMDYWGGLETSLVKAERWALDWKTLMNFKESRTLFLSGTDSRERLRVVRLGPALTLRDPGGVTLFDAQLSLGLDALGAALYQASSQRDNVGPDFTIIEPSVERIQKMPLGTRLWVSGKGHLSPDKLPSSEQLSLGGADSVRGYPEGDFFADQGFLMKAEYLVPFFVVPDNWKMPWSRNRLRDDLDFALFFDQGCGRFRSPATDQRGSECLSGTGVGVRARISENIHFTTDFAYAVGADPVASDQRFRIHSAFQASF